MYSKEELFQLETDIVNNIGFVLPFNNISLNSIQSNTNLFYWRYDPSTKNIVIIGEQENYNTTIISDIETDNVKNEYRLTHETGHLIQDFLMSNNIYKENIDEIDIVTYRKMICKFYNIKSIDENLVNDAKLAQFKKFVKECPYTDKETLEKMKFDDFYYPPSQNRFGGIDPVYQHNTNEICANYFAITQMYNKYCNNNTKSVHFMRVFGEEASFHASRMYNANEDITKEDFKEQIQRSAIEPKHKYHKIKSILRFKNFHSSLYKSHDFKKHVSKMNKLAIEVQKIINSIPIKYKYEFEIEYEKQAYDRAIKTLNNIEHVVPITHIDDYEPSTINIENSFKKSYTSIEEQLSSTKANAINPLLKEIVVDLKNKINYIFTKSRIPETIVSIADNILSDELSTEQLSETKAYQKDDETNLIKNSDKTNEDELIK